MWAFTCVKALQSMLALPINTCFLSTIQNLLWRTPFARRPKSTFLTWTPAGRKKKTRVKVKLVQRVGGLQDFVEEKANLFVLRSVNRWSLFWRWEHSLSLGQSHSSKEALQALSGCSFPAKDTMKTLEEKSLYGCFNEEHNYPLQLVTHGHIRGRVDTDVFPS